ncbi:Clavaminate synthase-like protein [Mrakia frigida]|uniref:Clavaminate synthase-like protein n=1 Tax=Mrakia frigida TaxID=29902 RepID=UPI003FCC0474
MSLPVRLSPQGAVLLSYKDLVARPLELRESIESGFGSGEDALGIVIVEDLPPNFPALREKLLRLSNSFASLPEEVREKYAREESLYSFGWSMGKEVMNGVPDLNKGSYYNNPLVDFPNVSEEEKKAHPMYYNPNVWPEKDEAGVEGFEEAFKELGTFIFEVGCLLSKACESFVAESLVDSSQSIENLISTSQCNKARLLHYFAPTDKPDVVTTAGEESEISDDLCGIHLDHSLITGLCSAIYLFHPSSSSDVDESKPLKAIPAPHPDSGLYIIPRSRSKTSPVKVAIPSNCLAFQTGEALQLCTGGRLRATPHFVQAGSSKTGKNAVEVEGVVGTVTRETFAFFLQPDVGAVVGKDPSGADETFGQFSKRIMEGHY